jgi:hypothetical protein|tara:strand:- start:4024 stop:4239 length:216 start_codon:yes stop_codon:yes gene_type:complete
MSISMAYCDYIAHTLIKPALIRDLDADNGLIHSVHKISMDLHKEGWMQTTTKTIECADVNGKKYKITIEEI